MAEFLDGSQYLENRLIELVFSNFPPPQILKSSTQKDSNPFNCLDTSYLLSNTTDFLISEHKVGEEELLSFPHQGKWLRVENKN